MADTVRMVHRRTGSVVVVPAEKADSVALADLGFRAEAATRTTAKKAAKKTAAPRSGK